jgi:hypothetical protein
VAFDPSDHIQKFGAGLDLQRRGLDAASDEPMSIDSISGIAGR